MAYATAALCAGCGRTPSPRVDQSIAAPSGFDVELVHEVDPETEGSWVALCAGPDGTLYAADEIDGLFRIRPPALDDYESPAQVQRVGIELRGAQGLLYAFDALYIMASGRGLLRVTDSDGDGEVDAPELIVEITAAGEHGSHAIALHPDGKSLLIACGNHTPLPGALTDSRVPRVWGEDQLLARDPDPRGHANGVMAPGGYICRVTPDGGQVELIACGFRNTYDVAVAPDGEIYTWDSDMEWDLGLPWYRPTRICQVVSGADFGWRHGSGKWPAHYEDSAPPALEIGPGSPTGMLFGTGAKFPRSYQRAMFMLDWTYGIIYAAHVTPAGAGSRVRLEQFIAGKPLPLTDAAMGGDGAMYFTTGGRRLGSRLHRIVYRGWGATGPDRRRVELTALQRLRRDLEAQHLAAPSADVIDEAWKRLGHDDRLIRHAARVALERQPVELWRQRAIGETDAATAAVALLALARCGDGSDRDGLLGALARIDPDGLDEARKLALARACALALIRMPGAGESAEAEAALRAQLRRMLPSGSDAVDVELTRALVALQDASVIEPALRAVNRADRQTPPAWAALARQNEQYGSAITSMLERPPPTDALQYAHMLSSLGEGWTFQQRQAYFAFLQRAASRGGGMSYRGYIEAMRQRALAWCSEHERAALAPLLTDLDAGGEDEYPIVFPKGPWREWTTAMALDAVEGKLRQRDFARGAGLYRAVSCGSCHQFNGRGSNVGPDLSSVGRRYPVADLVRAIIEPSHAVTDQYAVSVVTMTGGAQVSGLLVEATDERVRLAPNFADAATTTDISREEVESIELSKISAMPVGLVNALSDDELRDLIAYLVSGGNPEDGMFRR